MRYGRRGLFAMLCLALLMLSSGLAEPDAQTAPDLHIAVEMGYGGVISFARTMPVTVRIQNNGPDFSGSIAMDVQQDAGNYNRYEMELEIDSGAEMECTFSVYIPMEQRGFALELWQDGEMIRNETVIVPEVISADALLVGVLSDATEEENAYAFLNSQVPAELLPIQTVALTAENFPSDPRCMNEFFILVVEGFDVKCLTQQQQTTLENWLADGHVLILGGGAKAETSWDGFYALTGLAPEAHTSLGRDFFQTMRNHFLSYYTQIPEEEVEIALSEESAQADAIVSYEDTPLLWRTEVGRGVIFTSAFEWRQAELAQWLSGEKILLQLLRRCSPELYPKALGYRTSSNSYTEVLKQIPLKNDVNLVPFAAVAAVVLLGGGIGAYAWLRHKRKTQWMWVVFPTLAALTAAGICVAAELSPGTQPAAMIYSVSYQYADVPTRTERAMVVASPQTGEQTVSTDLGTLVPKDSTHRYFGNTQSGADSLQLNYRYMLGNLMGVGEDYAAPWRAKYYRIENAPAQQGRVDAVLWMEEDGVHGYIVNNLEVDLQSGVIISGLGYATVPELKAGERYEVRMRLAQFTDDDADYQDGCLYLPENGYYRMYSEALNAYLQNQAESGETSAQFELQSTILDSVIQHWKENQNVESEYAGNYLGGSWFVGFAEDMNAGKLYMNGQELARVSDYGCICADIPFLEAGDSEIVCSLPGMETPVICELDAQGHPIAESQAPLSALESCSQGKAICYMFEIADVAGGAVDQLAVYCKAMQDSCKIALYDGSEWFVTEPGASVAEPERYVDAQGRIFVKLLDDALYASLRMDCVPAILLVGRGQ